MSSVQRHLELPHKVEQEISCSKVPFCHIHIFYSKFISIIRNIRIVNTRLFEAEVEDYWEQMRVLTWLIFVILSRHK